MRVFLVSVLAVTAVLFAASPVMAGGANVYPNGAEGFWMGAAPPPGTYYVNYDLWYTSHRFTSNGGGEVKAGPLAGFKTDVFANVSRFIYISNKQFLGANWGAHIFVPVMDINTKSAGANAHVTGLGDIIIDPFILCWHSPTLHVTAGIDIYCPTGNYHPGRVANTGANAFVFEPVLAFSYMTPMKGLSASIKMMYDFPLENKDFQHPFIGPAAGDLQYGQEFHFDYSVDYMLTDSLKAGIGGYYYQQTTDDELNGVKVKNNKGRVWSLGPGFEYMKVPWIVSFRSQFEMDATNRPEGVSNWLRIVYIIGMPPSPPPAEGAES